MKIIAINSVVKNDITSTYGLGDDNKIYIWEHHKNDWAPYGASEEQQTAAKKEHDDQPSTYESDLPPFN